MLAQAAADTSPVQVLLVAEPSLASELADMLASFDFRLTLRHEPISLQQLADQSHFDLAIIDLSLVVASLSGPACDAQLPVILLGTEAEQQSLQDRFTTLEPVIEDFLLKPVQALSLRLKIRALIKEVRLSRQLEQQNTRLLEHMANTRAEAEMASYLFYNNLMDQVSDSIRGYNRFLKSSSDFCGDLTLARYSPSGSIFIMHVDATGHGLSATVTLMPVVDTFHSMVARGYALPMIVREMNRKLSYKLPPDRFVAASLVEVDLLHEQVSIWNGGMPPVLLLNAQGQKLAAFPSRHMALGILDNASFDSGVERIELPAGGGLFSCSDGFIDQSNAAGQAYGAERLLHQLATVPRDSLMSSLVASLKEFSGLPAFDDDVSLYYLYFPELRLFLDQQHSLESSRRLHEIHPFNWSMNLFGQQIARQEVASTCNDLLQGLGFPQSFCQRAFTVISELSNNAIDHGLLGLSSGLKTVSDGFAEYYVQRDMRLQTLAEKDHLRIQLDWRVRDGAPALCIEVQHSGEGFDAEAVLAKPREELSGRGLLLIRRLSSSLAFADAGRLAQAILE
ncbi:ATP-binding SpoIIE family protein phosphatase [Marinospirillum alkaliphilum]|uniref:Serine phosphatase RsbU, regulator of sigma subunit n=1 Tax=Marinospirillum alkaliphilum DSM 21637 TaxID=1122209 RepID=A0A1K1UCH7_9GAMM|nr:SpoIIE family protein phosphatase [Marinospirillum alkaliphilum]SFX10542.1 Serine phosphatase RsbU, regulator of sigma subunit [Marinospirillum alkaliphilum DSM 21637]